MPFPIAAIRPKQSGAVFSPDQITGIDFWLRVSRDVSNPKDGLAISALIESRGMAFSQATPANTPRLYCDGNGIGGKHVIHADGGDVLKSTSLLSGSSGAVVMVFRYTAAQNNFATLFCSSDEGTNTSKWRFVTQYTTPVAAVTQQNANDTTDGIRGTTTTLRQDVPYLVIVSSNGSAYSMRVNGVAQTMTVANGANNGDWWDDTTLRDNTTLFSMIGMSQLTQWVGDLAELIVYKNVTLSDGNITSLESYLASEYGIALGANQIAISTPRAYRTYQRDASNQASIAITGTYQGTPTAIEARWNGGTWATLDAAPSGNAFSGTLVNVQATSGAAQGDLEVRFANDTTVIAKQRYIGIGDIFGGGGQSNMSGRGTNNQVYSSIHGYKAVLYGNNDRYQELTDPWDRVWDQVDSVSNDSTLPGGSFLPLLATLIMNGTGFPVCFVAGAKGAVNMADWEPGADHNNRATLYGNMNVKLTATGARALLMYEGEGDVVDGTDPTAFNTSLDNIANSMQVDRGIKTMFAHIQDLSQYVGGYDETAINLKITEAEGDNANVLAGPNFADLTPNSDDHLHWKSDADLATVAGRWWTAIKTAFSW